MPIAIISGDSDFIALVNKLKQYDKTVFVVGGKAFTSTILQKNCHEFISYESMLDDNRSSRSQREQPQHAAPGATADCSAAAIPRGRSTSNRPRANNGRRATAEAAAPSAGARPSSGDAAGRTRSSGAGTARGAPAAGSAEIDHAATGFELQRARLRRWVVHRFHRTAAQGGPGSGDRRRRPLYDPAQANRRAGEDGPAGRGAARASRRTGKSSPRNGRRRQRGRPAGMGSRRVAGIRLEDISDSRSSASS